MRKVPGPSESVLKVPGPSDAALPNWSELVCTCRNLSGLVATCLDLSQLPVALRAGPWVPIPKIFRPDAVRLHPSYLQAVSVQPEGRRDGPADLARSTAEGVGGFATRCPSMWENPEIRSAGFSGISRFRELRKSATPAIRISGNTAFRLRMPANS